MRRQLRQSGFTAVELLITLFVAAAFLIAAYQLFNVVIRDGGNARADSRASNVAYDYLRRYAGSTTNPCVAYTPLTNSSISVSGLSNVTISVAITCPYSATSTVSRIEASITYNDPAQTSKYATYSYGDSGAASSDIIQGLIGWWQFNGNANSSVGNVDGTQFNTTPTLGQNGQPNGALNFNGINAYVSVPAGWADFSGGITVSLWANPTSTGSYARFMDFGNCACAGTLYFTRTSTQATLEFALSGGVNLQGSGALVNGVWRHYVFTRDTNGNGILYANGAVAASTTAFSVITNVTRTLNYFGRSNWTSDAYYSGAMDDFRIYNRALSQAEVQTLFTNGAK